MKVVIRYFFRTLRLILTPFMLISERLTRPTAMTREANAQAQVDQQCQQLALYQFKSCPFCIKVRKQIHRLALPIELRDAQHNSEHRQTLAQEGGKVKVPCLRIQHDDGHTQWLYESDQINAWLEQRFA
ncbi:glutaredoxin [Terasakiispira papahanaumokuakeensis]|uniref:Glutaredoxin n=1 Tax=Terasakiispira papahanaumokuakeensis TaxID=197479 RepID=A0A1E2VC17_9GAMM|nr:glutathione S-transferase N-terminal domain-containing protein [Terasakiispira papahanaumokuakeensis]ODC04558.1 glutaredoxin [Terasakiispira papahanaumokuakeensis]